MAGNTTNCPNLNPPKANANIVTADEVHHLVLSTGSTTIGTTVILDCHSNATNCPNLNPPKANANIVTADEVHHLILSTGSTTVGTTVILDCHSGYVLTPSEPKVTKCLATRKWDYTTKPSCVKAPTKTIATTDGTLTHEEKIIVGVTAGVGGVILVVLFFLIFCVKRSNDKGKKLSGEGSTVSVGRTIDQTRSTGLDYDSWKKRYPQERPRLGLTPVTVPTPNTQQNPYQKRDTHNTSYTQSSSDLKTRRDPLPAAPSDPLNARDLHHRYTPNRDPYHQYRPGGHYDLHLPRHWSKRPSDPPQDYEEYHPPNDKPQPSYNYGLSRYKQGAFFNNRGYESDSPYSPPDRRDHRVNNWADPTDYRRHYPGSGPRPNASFNRWGSLEYLDRPREHSDRNRMSRTFDSNDPYLWRPVASSERGVYNY